LAWAVVFCDIGTSVYYVPGILYETVGDAAPLFVFMTTIGFVLLTFKYVEISWRNPEGGGVVTVTTKAFNPRWGCLGGILITVDYFLTSAISSVSGIHYLGSLCHALDLHVAQFACLSLLLLAGLNIIGIKESAGFALAMAASALAVDLGVAAKVISDIGLAGLWDLLAATAAKRPFAPREILAGFGAAWLAFSGLESISQLSLTMIEPIRRTARLAMALLVVTVILTSPVLTLLAVGGLPAELKQAGSERLISELALVHAGKLANLAVVATASILLIFAANTAIIGGYHVFLALSEAGFFPHAIKVRNSTFGTPHVSILVAAVVPILIIVATQGRMSVLGDMYAFGLLGAFVLSSISLDTIRWRAGQRGLRFWIGVGTTAMVLLAWGVNLVDKRLATLFGGGVTALGVGLAIATQSGWLTQRLYRIVPLRVRAERAIAAAEMWAEQESEILTINQALELKSLYPARTLVAVRGPNRRLLKEAAGRARGLGERWIYGLFVDERPGLFVGGESSQPTDDARLTLGAAAADARLFGVELIPIWTVSFSAVDAIARAVEALKVDTVIVGVSHRSAVYHLLRGHVVAGLTRRLPHDCHLILCN